ncbi:protein FAM81B [Chanos chanos]|uniref:Protein FAM81B n=1 Tax=Chanos chanos TaxID=29144 RepID=A0A6J2UKF0_CHACN|nr:protein FAM81B [Chanos chanos]
MWDAFVRLRLRLFAFVRSHSFRRSGHLESRLGGQERLMTVLLEQAFRIKEDVVSSLRSAQGSVLMETSARKLLENHVLTITHIVKQLSKDIKVLEAQIVQRDSVTAGTSLAVHSLDHKNLAGIGDLRGRVARCDASIVKLSADVATGGQDILRLKQEVSELRTGLEMRLRSMEVKLTDALKKLETSQSDQLQSHSNAITELQKEIQQLESKTFSSLREMREETSRLREWTNQQLQSSAQRHTHTSQQLETLLKDKMVESEGNLKEQVRFLASQMERMEKQAEKEQMSDRLRCSETKLKSRISALEKSHSDQLDQIRREYQTGFQAIHDAIESLRRIGDCKARLEKGELQKDIRQMRRKIVQMQEI